MSDDAKKLILARRARFVAAALAGLAADGCGKTTAPPDAGAEMDPSAPVPLPCLTALPVTTGAKPPDAPAPPDADAAPVPCLSVPAPSVPPAPPRSCLRPQGGPLGFD